MKRVKHKQTAFPKSKQTNSLHETSFEQLKAISPFMNEKPTFAQMCYDNAFFFTFYDLHDDAIYKHLCTLEKMTENSPIPLQLKEVLKYDCQKT